MRKAIIFYNVTYVIGLYIYPRNPTNTVTITGSFVQFLEYDQGFIFLTFWYKYNGEFYPEFFAAIFSGFLQYNLC